MALDPNDCEVCGGGKCKLTKKEAVGHVIDEKLGDGSWVRVDPTAFRAVTISRIVEHGDERGDETVWAQVFDTGPIEEAEWPGPRVMEVVQSMRDMPGSFMRPWGSNGKAR